MYEQRKNVLAKVFWGYFRDSVSVTDYRMLLIKCPHNDKLYHMKNIFYVTFGKSFQDVIDTSDSAMFFSKTLL